MNLPATALPLRSEEVAMPVSSHKRDFGAELGALGYPGFYPIFEAGDDGTPRRSCWRR